MSERTNSKILIVDDDEGVTQTFARMLRLEGYQVRTAVSAETGLIEAEREPPRRNHPRPAHAARRRPRLPPTAARTRRSARDTPVAIVTGDYFLDDSVSTELRELGAELRFKPLWLEDLVGLARNLLKVTH